MARAMNVGKRVDALRSILSKTQRHSARADKIAAELATSFKRDASKEGKSALKLAESARKISRVLKRAADAVAV